MSEFEEEAVKVLKQALLKTMSEEVGYGHPCYELTKIVVERHRNELEKVIEDALSESLASEDFIKEIKYAIAKNVAKSIMGGCQALFDANLSKLKQNELFRAKLTVAINQVIDNMNKAN